MLSHNKSGEEFRVFGRDQSFPIALDLRRHSYIVAYMDAI